MLITFNRWSYIWVFNRNESEAIKDIVEKIVRLLDKTHLLVANNPVGVEPRVENMIQLLDEKIPNHTSELLGCYPSNNGKINFNW